MTAESAHFLSIDKPQVVVLFELAKGMVTGKAPDLGEVGGLGRRDRPDAEEDIEGTALVESRVAD